ncbi:TRAP transporter small permease [Chelativorans sp. SCAU2101]|jgi:TRAP-type C4-dicarboxylate transport system, small permease component|uniref:TRAP transporter small permease protein n=1 Tax=Chelativorans petroleitrophicus TaxID=2975484 RepID=A0A9X2XAH9_9HYPH|nr:TRAP transporter small permease [Chelativorans petroleitrophicus]MCT8991584.1 TRAP transporter small permease [Chelativorans petroleitrophicus]
MLRRLAQLEFLVASLLLAAIVALVFLAAVARTFGHPLIWSVDTAQLLFIWLCFLGATRAMREKGHLGIDLLIRWLPLKHRFRLELVLSIIVFVFLGLLAVEGYQLTTLNMRRQFGDSGISYAWVTSAVPAGCVMLAIALLNNIVRAWPGRHDGSKLIYSRSDDAKISGAEL